MAIAARSNTSMLEKCRTPRPSAPWPSARARARGRPRARARPAASRRAGRAHTRARGRTRAHYNSAGNIIRRLVGVRFKIDATGGAVALGKGARLRRGGAPGATSTLRTSRRAATSQTRSVPSDDALTNCVLLEATTPTTL